MVAYKLFACIYMVFVLNIYIGHLSASQPNCVYALGSFQNAVLNCNCLGVGTFSKFKNPVIDVSTSFFIINI